MRLPREASPFHAAIAPYLPDLTAAQQRGLALWVYGTILAGSARQTAVLLALRPVFGLAAQHALRQLLREWGADGAVPHRGVRPPVLRVLAALGAGVVGRRDAAGGAGRHRPA